MKKNVRFLMIAITIFTAILSACGGTTIPVTGSDGIVQALPTTFIAAVENITGNQWTLSGQTLTVDPGVVSEGPFNVGDLVKVEVVVNQDGTFAVSSVEAPTVQELSTLPRLDDGNVNSNDANVNDNTNDNANFNGNANINSNDNNSNAAGNNNDNSNVNSNSNDNNGNENNSNDANSNDDNDGNDNDDNENDNDSSGPGSGGNDNDHNGGNDNDDNDNG
jgi:hypothetical protein